MDFLRKPYIIERFDSFTVTSHYIPKQKYIRSRYLFEFTTRQARLTLDIQSFAALDMITEAITEIKKKTSENKSYIHTYVVEKPESLILNI